ncbi:MAG: chloride channel protein [Alphaproteobacteria bacterium]|nr:chloride channel protein [Alphaproteobacteria bacterium]
MIELILRKAPRVLYLPKIWVKQAVVWGGAVAIALAAILFAKASEFGNAVFAKAVGFSPYLPFLLIPAGFAFVVWLTSKVFEGAGSSGIARTIAAINAPEIADRSSALSLRMAIGKIVLTTLSLCVGASVGPEGPTVQIGAAIMHKMGKRLYLSEPQKLRALILAGGAAGIAAAFNTPLAGIIFAIEELAHSAEEKSGVLEMTTVIVAGVVSIALLGNYTYFGRTDVTLALAQAWKPVLLCGIVGGLLGGGFAQVLVLFSRNLPARLGRLDAFRRDRPILFAAVCGLILAVLGLFCGNSIFGTGYDEAKGLIEGTHQLPATFGLLKLCATALSQLGGVPGGLLAPSLAVGAGLGSNIAPYIPNVPVAAVIILGMVGYFTGVVQTPITATIIVMEMIRDPSLTLPLLATAFIAFTLSRLVCPVSLYQSIANAYLDHARRRHERIEPPQEFPAESA